MQPVRLCFILGKRFEYSSKSSQRRKAKQMQSMRLRILLDKQVEETHENTQWGQIKQMQPLQQCILAGKLFEDTFKNTQQAKLETNATDATAYSCAYIWRSHKTDATPLYHITSTINDKECMRHNISTYAIMMKEGSDFQNC